jgi:hypothetical protein
MRGRLLFLLACTIAYPAQAQTPADGVTLLLGRVESQLQTNARDEFASLVASTIPQEQIERFAADLFALRVTRAVVAERDRGPLAGTLPGDGYRVVAEIFTETAGRARIVTALLDVRRPAGGAPDTWRITSAQAVTSVEGLFRLSMKDSVQFAARNLTVIAEDLALTLNQGSVFPVESEAGVAGLVLIGRGTMRFSPQPDTERGQLRIFAGREVLDAEFDAAFVRLSPFEYETRVSVAAMTPAAVNPRELRRAREILDRDGPKSFSIDLRDLSTESWYLLPSPGDFLAEVQTRRHGALTYSRSSSQAEDITLYQRDGQRTVALYPSTQRRAVRGLSFNEDEAREYDVLDYDIEATIRPASTFLKGQARMRIRSRSAALSSLTLRLAEDFAVASVASLEYGRLLQLRVRGQDTVIVNFPTVLPRDTEFTMIVNYSGRFKPQQVDDEGLQVDASREDSPLIITEPNFLLSSRAYWYPQNPIPDYATATLRIIVPDEYRCVASGEPTDGSTVTLRDLLTLAEGRSFVFTAANPLRYFALVVSRFVPVATAAVKLTLDETSPEGVTTVNLAIEANPRLQTRARTVLRDAEAVVRFYAGLLRDVPYPSITVALVEDELPGGHSPGYFTVLNHPVPAGRLTWRSDPASFSGFPEFFIAHELAHQWWGQAVGWRNYHEQWLSEGFSQYFAALYARQTRGERTFTDMLRQFRRWSISESDEGPISLGNRLGHLRRQPRVFRALVYNKGAAVLHMLRRLVGEEVFFTGLRRLYSEQKIRKAGTDDLRIAMEAESGVPLERFFDRWIFGTELPRLRYTSRISGTDVAVRFEQVGPTLFDVPVTVTLVYGNGEEEDVVVPVTEQHVHWSRTAGSAVRQVLINRDSAALAVFERTSWTPQPSS